MSLLGFDAPGRLALGQLSTIGLTNTVLMGAVGSCAVSSDSAAFELTVSSGLAVVSATGGAAALGARLSTLSAAGLLTGNLAMLAVRISAGFANVPVAGSAARLAVSFLSPGAACGHAGQAAALNPSIRCAGGGYSATGYDSDFTRDFKAWFPRPFDHAGSWTGKTAAATPWTDRAALPDRWTAPPAPAATWTAASQHPESWTSESCRLSPPATIALTSATMKGRPPETS
ncbi:MAG TPA: hypothetical protein VGM09_14100 [Bradyrhizobium sp.]|jgi:hypothetical protein